MDSCRPERVPGIIDVRPDTSDTAEAALLPRNRQLMLLYARYRRMRKENLEKVMAALKSCFKEKNHCLSLSLLYCLRRCFGFSFRSNPFCFFL